MPKVTQTIDLSEEEMKEAVTDYLHTKYPGDARPFQISFWFDMAEASKRGSDESLPFKAIAVR